MRAGSPYYRPRRVGERRRKSIRGCIVGPDLAVLNLVVLKKGDAEVPGLTDEASAKPRRLGPKRASGLRKLFVRGVWCWFFFCFAVVSPERCPCASRSQGLTKEDDVRKVVIKRNVTTKTGKKQVKSPKIQRLVTPLTLQRKRKLAAVKRAAAEKSKEQKAEYQRLLSQLAKEKRSSSKRSSRRSSKKE